MKTVLLASLIIGCAEPSEPCAGAACGDHTSFFELGAPYRVAAGTRDLRKVTPAVPADVSITSSDPSILEVAVKDGAIELTSHRPGKVVLTAVAGNQPLDTLEVTAVAVSKIDVYYRAIPGANAPVTSFAAIAGQTDEICVTYRDGLGRALPGVGQFASANDAIEVRLIGESSRRSEGFAARSTCIGLVFLHAGETSLIATAGDASSSTAFTVDVVPPASSELSLMALHDWSLQPVTEAMEGDDVGGANVISKAADGRYVLGVDTTWKLVGAAPLFGGTHEVAFMPEGPGMVEITATSGGVEITRSVRVGS